MQIGVAPLRVSVWFMAASLQTMDTSPYRSSIDIATPKISVGQLPVCVVLIYMLLFVKVADAADFTKYTTKWLEMVVKGMKNVRYNKATNAISKLVKLMKMFKKLCELSNTIGASAI